LFHNFFSILKLFHHQWFKFIILTLSFAPYFKCFIVFEKQTIVLPRRIPPIHHQITPRHPSRGVTQEIDVGVGYVVGVAKT